MSSSFSHDHLTFVPTNTPADPALKELHQLELQLELALRELQTNPTVQWGEFKIRVSELVSEAAKRIEAVLTLDRMPEAYYTKKGELATITDRIRQSLIGDFSAFMYEYGFITPPVSSEIWINARIIRLKLEIERCTAQPTYA